METVAPKEEKDRRLVIGIDYGTTFTGVAISTPSGKTASLGAINIVQEWGPKMGNHKKIPSVISYSLSQNGEQQWGASLSPNSVAMVHTKLSLDVVDNSTELDMLLQALDGMRNLDFGYIKDAGGARKFPIKTPEVIVLDYLKKVFAYLLKEVAGFTDSVKRQMPVYIVATIPAEWGYRAKNSTFRALWEAGFNDVTFPRLKSMMLVTEPEAAVIYTARYLKELKGADFLQIDEVFVLCDAGGGTVDVVSYKVKSLHPNFEIEPVPGLLPTGRQCGSIFINLEFKKWLRELLGDHLYQQLDQGRLSQNIRSHDVEGARMRILMETFEKEKKRFGKRRDKLEIKIELPAPLNNLDLEGKVFEGQIRIPNKVMESFFEVCADPIVEMIRGQLEQIEHMGYTPENVMLVGGFAESPYLQSSIRESLEMQNIELNVPDTSLTAVVRGAVILGIEQADLNIFPTMKPCLRSYGVSVSAPFSRITHNPEDLVKDPLTNHQMAQGQLLWLIKKGDLILSNRAKEVVGVFEINFTESSPKRGSIPVYAYSGKDFPDRLLNSRMKLEKLCDIPYDLERLNVPLQEYDRKPASGSNPAYFVAPLRLTMKMVAEMLHVRLSLRQRKIAEVNIPQPRPESLVQLQ